MLAKFLASALLLASSSPVWACLPMPVSDRYDFFNDAAAQLLTHRYIKMSDIEQVSFGKATVVNYEWIETDSAYQCHDQETLKVNVQIKYRSSSKKSCLLSGIVQKTEGFYTTAPKPSYEFFDVIDSCTPSKGKKGL